ncbi:hypothetical protein [Prescottella equi]|uniref:hypothetical protein n=1 Tax=Rhodococcus hoagii TaxID=43767 RepID=UPI001C790437|nr:hypothetical protein [Prescottella equi]BCN44708.1 hypothetical protein RE9414_29880 [Prescottella equi]
MTDTTDATFSSGTTLHESEVGTLRGILFAARETGEFVTVTTTNGIEIGGYVTNLDMSDNAYDSIATLTVPARMTAVTHWIAIRTISSISQVRNA